MIIPYGIEMYERDIRDIKEKTEKIEINFYSFENEEMVVKSYSINKEHFDKIFKFLDDDKKHFEYYETKEEYDKLGIPYFKPNGKKRL